MKQAIIRVTNGVPRHPQYRMKEPVNFSLLRGEQLAIVGRNGAGKSLLVDILTGRWPLLRDEVQYDFSPSATNSVYENVKYIAFRDSYGDADGSYYYQQRWHSQDVEEAPLVKSLLPEAYQAEAVPPQLTPEASGLFERLGLQDLLDKPLVLLSSGELRKFQLAKALLTRPRLLILDNPFIGLDAPTRDWLRSWLQQLIREVDLQLILVLSRVDELPDFITHVVEVADCTCGPKLPRETFLAECPSVPERVLTPEKEALLLQLPYADGASAPVVPMAGPSVPADLGEGHSTEATVAGTGWTEEPVIEMHRVSIRYGERTILKDLDWRVCRGERWALQGANGSGKSTLLSLVCADNPQSYACNLALFGRQRGSGESIWEIKRRIGYVSPEMHRAYRKALPAIDIVASGLHDSVGLYLHPRPEQRAICETWLDLFGVAALKDRNFLQLSSGEQRLVLLARAFVKDPELLVLDEPLHGLDGYHRRLVKDIIETFCQRKGKTLVMVTHYVEELPACITHSLQLQRN